MKKLSYRLITHSEVAEIRVFPSEREAALAAAEEIASVIVKKPFAAISFATGNTMIPVYSELVKLQRQRGIDFSQVQCFHLDEYFPISATDDQSFVYYLQTHLFGPLHIPVKNIFTINGQASDPVAEAARYDTLVNQSGQDLTILGIGPGGHIGYNERNTPFDSRTHFAQLSKETIQRDKDRGMSGPPTGITQGIGTIMDAQKIILIAFGESKAEVVKEALQGPIDPACPASALRNAGSKVTFILDEAASSYLL